MTVDFSSLGAYAERPPSPGAYRHNAEVRQKQSKEQEKTKKKLAQYKSVPRPQRV